MYHFDPTYVKRCLRKLDMRASKAQGQNFLVDEGVAREIVNALVPGKGLIVEVGAGLGALTSLLVESGRKIYAYEKDKRLADFLRRDYHDCRNLIVFPEDILLLNHNNQSESIKSNRSSIIGNLPYSSATRIIRLFLYDSKVIPMQMIFMVQKEVAGRILGVGSKQRPLSLLSVVIGLKTDVKEIASVPPKAFFPVPEVDSVVLEFIPHQRFSSDQADKALRVAKTAFSSPRKTLVNNLASGLQMSKSDIASALSTLNLQSNVRPHQLSISQIVSLSVLLDKFGKV